VIEAVFEDPALKHQVFAEAARHVDADALLCSNTSTLPITELATGVDRPADFIGLHFFSPVDKMPLVEIIVGAKPRRPSPAVDVVSRSKARSWSTTAGASAGGSRHLLTEAAALLGRSRPRPSSAPAGFPAAAGDARRGLADPDPEHPRIAGYRQREGRPVRQTPQRGRHRPDGREFGRKGQGGRRRKPTTAPGRQEEAPLRPGLREHFTTSGGADPLKDVQERYLFRMALETARCFEEGVIESSRRSEHRSIFGIGFHPAVRRHGAVATAGLRADCRTSRAPGSSVDVRR
jgi:3-hydroxyacyl-CoA dehydrogenase/enoyl-CoA hydratase/3-hydroxybutyryl-CoA epimerase